MVCKNCQKALVAGLITTLISFSFAKSFSSQPLSDTDLRLYLRSRDSNSEFDFIRPVRKDINRSTRSTRNAAFQFSAFSEKFDLSLEKASAKSFDAGLVISTIGKDGKAKISSPKQGCYHTGVSLLHEGSSASVNLCDKFSGMIKTDEAHYDILPLIDEHIQKFKKSGDINEIPSHIITRRATVNTKNCDLNVRREVDNSLVNNRRRRDLVDTRYVEISVVADDSIFAKYGAETEQYILSAFDEVAALFQDSSLDVDLRIHVSGFTILESPQENLKLVDELSRTITSFCEWQREDKSDVSVLITGKDLKTGGTSIVTGKAVDVGGACNPLKKCVVTEDHGPSQLALALTHEIGHSIGMYHDDGFSECNDQHYIMSPKESSASFLQWSECSNKDLMDFLKSTDSHCLENKPETLPVLDGLSVVLQGFYVNSTSQCQKLHGQNGKVNPKLERTSEICSNLQCIVDGKLLPSGSRALDGTQCGPHKRNMCLMGTCVEAYSTQVCADNPGGICEPEWIADDWGECINCVETRLIFCVEFHDDNTIRLVTDLTRCPAVQPATTRDCCTSTFQYDVGEYGECSATCGTGTQTRTVECRNGNNVIVADELCPGVKPTTTRVCPGLPACEDTDTYTVFAGALSECSTTCGPGTRSRSVFCFRNSIQQVDTGFCIAAGLEIPPSQVACNLVPCEEETFRFIEGTFSECSVTCGSGEQSRVVVCVDGSNSVVATETCLQAGLTEPPSTISCNLQSCPTEVVYDFVAGDFPACPNTCGVATVTRSVVCESENGVVVPDIICTNRGLVKPATEFDCTLDPCPTFAFVPGAFGACSTTCGTGVQERTVECQNSLTNDVVADEFCTDTKPAEVQACVGDPCPSQFQYITGPFGDCSCDGVQTRLVICVEVNGVALSPVEESICQGLNITLPPTSQACPIPETCSGPVWTVGEWSECPVTCGAGIQTRLVYCIANPGSTDIVSDDDCVPEDRPTTFQPCDTQVECPPEYLWLATEFGACSVTCGEGIRSRSVLCYSIGINGFEFVDPANCVPADEPATVEACTEDPCSGVFVATPWSECSVTCGQGEETRVVTCSRTKDVLDPIPLTECDESVPSDTRVCYQAPCPQDFGCDVSYDASTVVSFTISSPNYPNNYPADLDCLRVIQAPEGNHVEITFTDFVMEPGCAYDTLSLTDVENNNTVSLFCDELPDLPFTYVSVGRVVDVLQLSDVSVSRRGFTGSFRAVTNDVLRYVPGNWSECDVTCGEGIQVRTLTCLLNDVEVDLLDCSGLETPATARSCFREPCPRPDVCDVDVLRTEAGSITSPGFPNAYPANTTCSNLIVAPEGQVVEVSIAFMSLEESPGCRKDALLVSDSEDIARPLSFCGEYEPQVIFTSLTNEVRVTFMSDDSVESTGYTITFTFVDPTSTECGSVVTSPGQVIASPGYPEGYNNSEDCTIGVLNADGCVELVFTDFDIPSDRDCNQDYVLVEDLVNLQVVRKMCGGRIPPPFMSASGSIRVTFISDGNITGRGYTAVPRFVECPAHVQVPREFGECSVSCGVGVEVREIVCIDALTGDEVDDDFCEDLPRLPSERPCDLGECPSCDLLINMAQSEVVPFPADNPTYSNNQDCRITITNPDGCVTIVFVSIDLQPGSLEGLCDTDYIELTDSSNPRVSLQLCGDPRPYPLFNSISNTVTIDFRSDDAVVAGGFSFYPNFNDCPAFAFIPEPYGACSVSCGGGVRTRSVVCRNLVTNTMVTDVLCGTSVFPTEEPCGLEPCPTCNRNLTESGLIVSPDNELGFYPNNTYCEYYISNPDDEGCLSLSFLEFQLEEVDENGRCKDFITVIDLGFPEAEYTFCENLTNLLISRSSEVLLSFTSDESGVAPGYQIFVGLVECPAFAYDVGEFGECSVTCGNDGVRTRSVQCINVETLSVAPDSVCPNIRPRDTLPCEPQEECIPCDLALTTSGQYIDSFNYPGNYDNNQQCTYTITNPDGCVRVSILIFSLDEGDSLEIIDDGYEFIGTTLTGERSITSWSSRTGSVTLNFRADDEDNNGNFKLYEQFVPCPVFGYVAGELSDCSTTCGPGVRTRLVECVVLETLAPAEDRLCTDPRPETEVACFEEECPTCDRYITDLDSDMTIQSPGFPMPYEANLNCEYVVNSTRGMCINIFVIAMDIEGPVPNTLSRYDACIGYDALIAVDNEFPYRVTAFCGQSGVFAEPIASYGSVSTIVFASNNNSVVGAGFNAFVAFVPCTVEYAYSVGEFGECDATCGEAFRSRSVECIEIADGDVVSMDLCEEEAPASLEPCEDLPECPSCDASFNETVSDISSPDFPSDYPSRTSCVYTVANPESTCVRIAFTLFDLFGNSDDCEDYIEISEPAYPFNDPVRFCPVEGGPVPEVFRSLSPLVEVLFVSSQESEGGTFRYFALENDCPTFGYVAGPFSECPITCGDVSQLRVVNCVNLETGEVVGDGSCEGDKPPTIRACDLPDCPSCDGLIQSPNELIQSPGYEMDGYGPFTSCLKVILNSDGCINLFFADIDLEPRNETTGECQDFIEVSDNGAPTLTQKFCGDELEGTEWLSRSGGISIRFSSDLNGVEGQGFSIFPTFVACPVNGFEILSTGDCSTTCGEGQRTRDVRCVELATNTPVADSMCSDPRPSDFEICDLEDCPVCDRVIEDTVAQLSSENYPMEYPLNQQCDFDFVSPDSRCWRLFFSVLDFPEPDMLTGCDEDYLLLTEVGEYGRNERYCGYRETFFINSRYPQMRLTLVTDGVSTGDIGFEIAARSLGACPTVGFVAGEFGNCSKACGGGERSRTISCLNLRNGEVVSESMCAGEDRPAETEACNLEPCPSCDQYFNTSNSVIRSPNYPLMYEPNQVCSYQLVNPGGCLQIVFEDLELQDPNEDDICDADALQISDDGPFSDHLTEVYCGDVDPAPWLSRTGDVTVVLSTDSSVEASGFSLRMFYNTCPTFGYVYTEWSGCSVTCGSGLQFRNISCQNLELNSEVDASNCPEDPPATSRICTLGPCPSCDLSVSSAPATISSPNYPMRYPNSASCEYKIFNPAGCVQAVFSSLDLQSDDESCVDSILFADDISPRINTEYCGSPMPLPPSWHSLTGNVTFTFNSDPVISGNGFSLSIAFVECASYSFVIEDIGMCSVTCGGGIQNRTVSCKRMDTMDVVDDDYCIDAKPATIVACNDLECPVECGNVLIEDTPEVDLIQSPGFGSVLYENNLMCLNTIINFNGCIRVALQTISIQPPLPGEAAYPYSPIQCDKDYVQFRDPSFTSITERYCGYTVPTFEWRSGSSVAQITLVTDGSVRDEGYSLTYNFIDRASCPQFEFVETQFSECSTTCGDGAQTRESLCRNNLGQAVAFTECRGARPEPSRPCFPANDPCPSFQYEASSWSMCSVTCGTGLELRNVTCVDSKSNPVNETLCEDVRPDTSRNCTLAACPPPVFVYITGNFSECQATCGDSVRTRNVTCVDEDGNPVSDVMCTDARPDEVMPCNEGPCYEYATGNYSDCSVTCGVGMETRPVTCRDVGTLLEVNETFCSDLSAPSDSRACFPQTCPVFNYMASGWSECSVTCGNGTRTRNITCEDQFGNVGTLADCTPPAPPSEEDCATGVVCVSQIATCGSTVSPGVPGNFSSPNYPSNYENDLNCIITFQVSENSIFRLIFDTLDVDFGDGLCGNDFIRITGRQANGDEMFTTICSALQLPFEWTSDPSDTTVIVAFTTDSSVTATGFFGTYDEIFLGSG